MIRYKIYVNDGLGGPVDYSAPVGDTASLAFTTAVLAAGGSYAFAVHPYDTATGYEDRTADSRRTITLDASGHDASGLPAAPAMLHARAAGGGTARVNWYYPLGLPVTGFHVYAWPDPGPPNLTTPAGSVPGALYRDGTSHAAAYSFLLTGLTPGASYLVCVRGYNAAGEGANTGTAAVTAAGPGPDPIPSLSAAVSP